MENSSRIRYIPLREGGREGGREGRSVKVLPLAGSMPPLLVSPPFP